jgi:ethanolamine utilization protein EutQ (cupin superfamily)
MSIHHLSIDDTRVWFQASDREVYIGDVMDLVSNPTTRVRFARYGKGARHEWIVTHDETLIVTKGALAVRSASGTRTVSAGNVVSLTRGTRVVYEGDEDGTEVVFVTYVHQADVERVPKRPELVDDGRTSRSIPRVTSLTFPPAA